MLLKLLSYSAVAALALAGTAHAANADTFYFKGAVGYGFNKGKATATIIEDKEKPAKGEINTKLQGVILDIALGYSVADEFRAELDLMHAMKHKVQVADGALASGMSQKEKLNVSRSFTAVMANGYYDFTNASDFTPYVGAGVGYGFSRFHSKDFAKIKKEGSTIKSKNSAAFSAATGMAYKISDSMVAEFGYKMLYMPSILEIAEKQTDKHGKKVAGTVVKIKFPAITHTANLGLRVSF